MAAATSNQPNLASSGGGLTAPWPVAAGQTIYNSVLVCSNSTGGIVNLTDSAGLTFQGLSQFPSQPQGPAGASGVGGVTNPNPSLVPAPTVAVSPPIAQLFIDCQAVGAVASTWLGQKVYGVDNLTVALTSSNAIQIGRVVQVLSSTLVRVDATRQA